MGSFFRKNALIGAAEIICRLPLIFTVGYLARSIGTANFGNWALIVAFQVFVAGLAGLGLSSSLSRFVPSSKLEDAAAYLRYAFVLCCGPILIALVLAYVLRAPIGRSIGIRTDLYWLLPMAVLMAGGSVADGFFDAYFKARMAVVRQVCFIVARTSIEVVAVVLVFVVTLPSLHDVSSRLAAYVGAVVIGKIAIYPWLLVGMTKGGSLPPLDRRRAFLKYGLPMVPTVLVIWLISQSDRLVLIHFVSKSELGVYAFAASLASYTVYLGYAVFPLLLPGASKLYDAGDTAGVQALFRYCQNLFVMLWAAGMACLALWSADVIAWTGGPAFAGAGPILLILCFSVGIERVLGIYQFSFHLVKRTDLIFWLNAANAAMLIAGLWVTGATSGITYAPWAVVIVTLVFNVIRYSVARRYLHIAMEYMLIVRVGAVVALTALLARYGVTWGVDVRLAISAAIIASVGLYVLRRRADPASEALVRVGISI